MSWVEKVGLMLFLILLHVNEEMITAEIIIIMTAALVCFFLGGPISKWLMVTGDDECSES